MVNIDQDSASAGEIIYFDAKRLLRTHFKARHIKNSPFNAKRVKILTNYMVASLPSVMKK
jgi:hypothetical protein